LHSNCVSASSTIFWYRPLYAKRDVIFRGMEMVGSINQYLQFNCMYPCASGYYGDPERECTSSLQTVTRYQKRISGSMLDRIDIHIEVQRVDFEKLSDSRCGESSDKIRDRFEKARQRQRERFSGRDNRMMSKADMHVAEVRPFCELDESD